LNGKAQATGPVPATRARPCSSAVSLTPP
jgi:hypothetical protein